MKIEECDEFPYTYDPEGKTGIAQRAESTRQRRSVIDRLEEITKIWDRKTGNYWFFVELESSKTMTFFGPDCSEVVARNAKLGELVVWNEVSPWLNQRLSSRLAVVTPTITIARIDMKIFFQSPGLNSRDRD